ncbi:hypothetical protein FB550_10934 [Neobacillus bataviensis]|uniref:Uncharacterized protein n=1 Tax=Neobacillus bataviensis TaxID=220685 RepID=A0A561D610_9BACI|nr:hypothetical protein FB550_10934 [Neobacillus bataviensis]
MTDLCICCGSHLAKMERNRCVCWECSDKSNESYEEAHENDK